MHWLERQWGQGRQDVGCIGSGINVRSMRSAQSGANGAALALLRVACHGTDASHGRLTQGAQGNLKVMRREMVTLLMKGAAVDWGLKPKHVATHSIRISGATTLLIAGVPAEVVKIVGRWINNAFIGYTRYQAELMAGISQRMVNTSYVVRPF